MKYFHAPIPNRSCGECSACCTSLRVEELDKPMHSSCHHICKNGCEIYDARPTSCRNFECGWLKGEVGLDKHRPDKLGLIFSARKINDQAMVYCYEYVPQAASRGEGKWMLDQLRQKVAFRIYYHGERKSVEISRSKSA